MTTDETGKSYLVYILNLWFIIPFMLISFILPLFLLDEFIQTQNIVLVYVILILFIGFAYFLTRKFFLRPIQVYFNEEKIVFQYLSNDLKKVRREKIILIKYVNGFSDFNVQDLTFRLKLHYGAQFSLYKSRFWDREDDFELLIADFKEFIKDYNTSEKQHGEITTKRGKIEYKDFFKTKNATLLFYVAIAILILTLYKTYFGSNHNAATTITVITASMGYMWLYWSRRK